MALTSGIVSFWKLGEASGNRADSVGSNTLVPTGSPGNVAGRVGNAVQLTAASSQYLSITDAAQSGLDMLLGSHAISTWIYPDSMAAANRIVSKTANNPGVGSPGYALLLNTNGSVQCGFSDGSGAIINAVTSGVTVTTAAWWHIIVNFNRAGNMEILVNGVSRATASISAQAGSVNATQNFYLGVRNNLLTPWDGRIDATGVWSRILTSQEVIDLYNGGNGLEHPFSTYVPRRRRNLALMGL